MVEFLSKMFSGVLTTHAILCQLELCQLAWTWIPDAGCDNGAQRLAPAAEKRLQREGCVGRVEQHGSENPAFARPKGLPCPWLGVSDAMAVFMSVAMAMATSAGVAITVITVIRGAARRQRR